MNKYWGRKNDTKPPSSSSSPTSIISNWFSKSKLKLLNNSPKPTIKPNFPITPPILSGWGEGRFYSMDEDDAYWRLSFGDESWMIQGRRSTGGINVNPLWYDNHHHVPAVEIMPTNEKYKNFNEMVSDIRKMRERHPNHHHHQRDVYPVESDCVFEPHVIPISELKKLKEIKVKMEYQNKSSRNRVKATYSPRTECKIRALEDMKKARKKKKKKKKKEIVEEKAKSNMFDSFAVVKSSFNPQKDFRDSMVEMIREKGIAGPEEFEQLLACYLTLNSDEYHDLIIKVFRQLWSDIHSQCFH